MKIVIKNMVCDRCVLVVQNVLTEMDLVYNTVHMGEVDLGDTVMNAEQTQQFQNKIESLGFELINDKKTQLIENIKKLIIQIVQHESTSEKFKLSDYLSTKLFHDYSHLSNIFSNNENVTIEQYFINQKIEKTKELLIYDEQTLTQISYQLGYSSVAHLSRQFKKVTGVTTSEFKLQSHNNSRQAIDKV